MNPSALQEFQAIYRDEFGEELDAYIAEEMATKLLTLFNAIYRPLQAKYLVD